MSQARKHPKRRIEAKRGSRRPWSPQQGTAARRRQRLLSFGLPALIVAMIVVVAVALSLGGGNGGSPGKGRVSAGGPARSRPLAAGALTPKFSAPGLDGDRVTWSDYRGSPTVLVVWAPWCPHCQKELPVLSRVAGGFPSVKLVTVVTATGLHPGPTPQQYVADHGLSFPVAVDDGAGTISGALGLSGFPTVYYVDRSGRVVHVAVGEVPEAQMRASFGALAGA